VIASARRVLIVEGDEFTAVILREVLTGFGYTLEVALDNRSALVKSASFRPEVVVLDVGAWSLDERAVVQELRRGSDRDRLKVFAMSGYGRPQDTARAMAAGFDHYFTKPVDVEALALAIDG
jgi:CheY-like chemotaxis protein